MVDGIGTMKLSQSLTSLVTRLFPPRLEAIMEEVQNHRQGRRRVAFASTSFQWPTYLSSARWVNALVTVRAARNVSFLGCQMHREL